MSVENLEKELAVIQASVGKMKEKITELYRITPEQKEPELKTTVTVWRVELREPEGYDSWEEIIKKQYTFDGLPDIGAIISDTLKKGALAIKVECTKSFMLEWVLCDGCYLLQKGIGHIKWLGWRYEGYIALRIPQCTPMVTDADIEVAITKYLKHRKTPEKKEPAFKVEDLIILEPGGVVQIREISDSFIRVLGKDGSSKVVPDRSFRHATPAEVDDWYRRDIGHGVTAWAKKNDGSDELIDMHIEYEVYGRDYYFPRKVGLAICEKLGVPVRVVKKEED